MPLSSQEEEKKEEERSRFSRLEPKPEAPPKTHSRLMVKMNVFFENGTSREVLALVDPGAEVNLIRRDIVDPKMFHDSAHPVRLGVANSTKLMGGGKDVHTLLSMKGVEMDTTQKVELRIPFVAYDANISHEIILSYAWLAENDILVNPTKHGLIIRLGGGMFWVEGVDSPVSKKQRVILLESESLGGKKYSQKSHKKQNAAAKKLSPPPEPTRARGVDIMEVEAIAQQLQSWQLSANPECDMSLNFGDLTEIASQFCKEENKEVDFVKGFVTSRDPLEGTSVEERRNKVFQGLWQNRVFRTDDWRPNGQMSPWGG